MERGGRGERGAWGAPGTTLPAVCQFPSEEGTHYLPADFTVCRKARTAAKTTVWDSASSGCIWVRLKAGCWQRGPCIAGECHQPGVPRIGGQTSQGQPGPLGAARNKLPLPHPLPPAPPTAKDVGGSSSASVDMDQKHSRGQPRGACTSAPRVTGRRRGRGGTGEALA